MSRGAYYFHQGECLDCDTERRTLGEQKKILDINLKCTIFKLNHKIDSSFTHSHSKFANIVTDLHNLF